MGITISLSIHKGHVIVGEFFKLQDINSFRIHNMEGHIKVDYIHEGCMTLRITSASYLQIHINEYYILKRYIAFEDIKHENNLSF